jgi:hypothetical protein
MGVLRVDLIWRLEDLYEAPDKSQLLFSREKRRDSELEATISCCIMSVMRKRRNCK